MSVRFSDQDGWAFDILHRMLRFKPSKPMALLSVVFGIGMITFALVNYFQDDEGEGRGFLIFWCFGVVAIVGLNLWAAFSKKGSMGTFISDDRADEEHR